MRDNLYKEMNRNVAEWYKSPPCCQPNNLYIIIIAHNKAVLFVMQLNTDCVSTFNIRFFFYLINLYLKAGTFIFFWWYFLSAGKPMSVKRKPYLTAYSTQSTYFIYTNYKL